MFALHTSDYTLICFHNPMILFISVSRLLNVSNAWYADCNGLYSLSNLTAVWDKKRVVYMRIHGGINPGDRRYDASLADLSLSKRLNGGQNPEYSSLNYICHFKSEPGI